jgi:hypothetical protein
MYDYASSARSGRKIAGFKFCAARVERADAMQEAAE